MESGDSVIRAWLKRWWPWIAVVVVSMFLVGRSQLQAEQLTDTVNDVQSLTVANRGLVTSLQSAIVESCRKNGNASRKVTRETIEEEKHEAEYPDPAVIAALHIPPALLERLTRENIARLEGRLARVHPVNCAAQYHISPGSGTRRRSDADSSTP